MIKSVVNIIVCGIGGQGILTLSNIIRKMALSNGYKCEGATFKGGAQRMGSIHSELRIITNKPHKVISSQWCRCKETAFLGFKNYETKNFLNSFFSTNFTMNKNQQMKELKKYVDEWESKKNLILVTHYVVIYEVLGYGPSSGEIVVSDKNFKKIGSIEIDY